MNVGISLLATENAHIWSSGLNQNLAFLVMLLRKSPLIDNIYLLNGGDSDQLPTGMDIALEGAALVRPQDVTHALDVVIEMGAQMPTPWLRHVRALGTKVVLFLVGQAYAAQIEYPIFARPGSPTFSGSTWDEVWMLPQHVHSGMPLMRTLSRLPVYELPHIWSPIYLEQQAKAMRERGKIFGFDPHTRVAPHPGWRVGIFEPNISVLKNSVIPMLACEHACRLQPDAIDRVMVLNTLHMKENQTFSQFALHLDITRLGKASYEPRVTFAECMAEFSLNAVVAHQWECELNYAYYDALYGGYPLVHNSDALKHAGVGLYYPGFSATDGGRVLLQAGRQEPGYWHDYQRASADWLSQLAPEHPANISAFTRRLQAAPGMTE
jgi:hypothetical protein